MIIVLHNHYYIMIYKLECAGELAIASYAISWVYLMGYTTTRGCLFQEAHNVISSNNYHVKTS